MKNLVLITLLILSFFSNLQAQNTEQRLQLEAFASSMKAKPDTLVHCIVHSSIEKLACYKNGDSTRVRFIRLNEDEYALAFEPGESVLEFRSEGLRPLTLAPFNYDLALTYEFKLRKISTLVKTLLPVDYFEVRFTSNANSVSSSISGFDPVPWNGNECKMLLRKGTHTIDFYATGYEDFSKNVTIKNDTSINLQMTPGKSSEKLTSIKSSQVSIASAPADARLYIDGVLLGNTPYTGLIPSGNHELMLVKESHYIEVFPMREAERGNISKTMRSVFGFLAIDCTTPESKIFLNNELIGEAPLNKVKLAAGSYSLRVEGKGFVPYNSLAVITAGEELHLDICLLPNAATLVVNSDIIGADVLLNGIYLGKTPFMNMGLSPGAYELTIRKDNFKDLKTPIVLSKLDTLEKEFFLGTTFAQIKISTDSAKIFMNSEHIADNSLTKRLMAGTYTFSAQKDEFHFGATEKVTLLPGDKLNLRLQTPPILQMLSVTTNPENLSDVLVYINDEYKGTSPLQLKVPSGDIKLVLKKDGFPDHTSFFTLSQHAPKIVAVEMKSNTERQQIAEMLHTYRNYSLYASVGFSIAGGAFYAYANNQYAKYKSASAKDDISNYKQQVKKWDNLTQVSFSVASGFLITSALLWFLE